MEEFEKEEIEMRSKDGKAWELMPKQKIKTLGIIPAREGSKRLKYKNMQPFPVGADGGLLPLAVLAMKKANECLDHTIVSMDSAVDRYNTENLVEAMRMEKVELVERPRQLGQDDTKVEDVVLYHLQDEKYKDYDTLVFMQPTSPLFSIADLQAMLKIFEKENRTIASVNKYTCKFDGACIIISKENFLKNKVFWMPPINVYLTIGFNPDIDDMSDYAVAWGITRGNIHGSKSE